METFSGNSARIDWQCSRGHKNVHFMTHDKDPIQDGNTMIMGCRECQETAFATVRISVERNMIDR